MKINNTLLFDLDGVIIDTESQYDVFWKQAGEKYQVGIDHFERVVKGTTLPNIISRYFSHLPEEEQQRLMEANHAFDLQMTYDFIPGAKSFLDAVKNHGIKTGLVTSSGDAKLKKVFDVLSLDAYFDTVVSADRIREGKPNPMCYLLAAKDLDARPEECIVFEDSFQGIEAGNRAGMRVVGLYTTNPKASIVEKVWKAIPHFDGFTLQHLI